MTDFSKYKNISVKNETYAKIDKIRKVLVPDDPNVSRAQVVTILVNSKIVTGKHSDHQVQTLF